MIKPAPPDAFDLFVMKEFFDGPERERLLAEMRSAPGAPAAVYGQSAAGSVQERMRKVSRRAPQPETVEFVRRRLMELKAEVERHFSLSLSECEEPQFLRYGVGDFFVAHQDGNTGLLQLDREARRVSVVILLDQEAQAPGEGDYCGGSLLFHDWGTGRSGGATRFSAEPGTLVAFRSETTHEVTPVTHGERHSIASWYR